VSDEEFDPEVAADLAFREASERDTTRTRGKGVYDWTKVKFVAMWRCKRPGCVGTLEITQEAVDALETSNRELDRRGERRIATSEVVYCETCRKEFLRTAPDRRRAQVDRMAYVIQQLKAGETRIQVRDKDGERWLDEREAFDQLEKWGHPDVKGFEEALKRRRERDNKSNARRSAV
jgi:hypothetical protein